MASAKRKKILRPRIAVNIRINGKMIAEDTQGLTMPDVAKKRRQDDAEASQSGRSPSWTVYARLDPELQGPVEAYIEAQEYPPPLARVIERALRELLSKHGFWPPKNS